MSFWSTLLGRRDIAPPLALPAPVPSTLANIDRAQRETTKTRADGWANEISGLGTSRDAWRSGNTFHAEALWQSAIYFDQLYMFDDLVHLIVSLPASEMTREFIDITNEDGDVAEMTAEDLRRLDAQAVFQEALVWRNNYGGSLVVMVTDDEPTLDKPLRIAGIRNMEALRVFDRFEVGTIEYGDDGQPSRYYITSRANAFWVHASRCLRFDGLPVPHRYQGLNNSWGMSVVQLVHKHVQDFNQAHDTSSALLKDFAQAVIKIKDLSKMLMADEGGLVTARLRLLDTVRSVLRMVPLDAETEDFTRVPTPLTGLPELLDRKAQRLAAATRIPVTLLMGQSPAGLNATGDADIRYWYDRMRAAQETTLREPLRRLIEILEQARKVPADRVSTFSFRPLWQATDKEKAETRYIMAQADDLGIGNGSVDPSEVRASRFGGDKFSVDTKLDTSLDTLRPANADDPTSVVDPAAQAQPVGMQKNAGAAAGAA